MAKVKYRYNPEKLSYDVITTSFKQRLVKWSVLFAASIVIAVIYFIIYSSFYDTPKERTMSNQLSALKFNYQMLMQDLNQIDLILADIQKRDDDVYRTILESKPIPSSIRQAGIGGVNRYQHLEGYDNSALMITAAKHTDNILRQLYVQSISYDELIERTSNKEQMASSRPAIQPIASRDLRSQKFSRYGMRPHPVYGDMRMHTGIDLGAKTGTPIYATGDGKVVQSEFRNGYGWTVVIDHSPADYLTLYAHMQRRGVEVGTELKRGQVIGFVGSTGTSTSPHVHYEVHKGGYGKRVDPIHYFYNDFSDDEYLQLVEQAQNDETIFEDWQMMDDNGLKPIILENVDL